MLKKAGHSLQAPDDIQHTISRATHFFQKRSKVSYVTHGFDLHQAGSFFHVCRFQGSRSISASLSAINSDRACVGWKVKTERCPSHDIESSWKEAQEQISRQSNSPKVTCAGVFALVSCWCPSSFSSHSVSTFCQMAIIFYRTTDNYTCQGHARVVSVYGVKEITL